jgi:hypothetical protein
VLWLRRRAAGTVTQPTEAALRTALQGGGLVKIQTSDTIAPQNELVIQSETTIDAPGLRGRDGGTSDGAGGAWGALTRLDAAVAGAAWRLSRVPSASQLAAGTYQIDVLAFDRVGNIGVARSSFGIGPGVVAPPTTRLSIASATQSNAGDNRMWNVEVKLRFSGPLQPASAANASLYTIESITDGSFAVGATTDAITASYSAADNTVTLRFLAETGYIGRDILSPVSTVEISWAGLRDVHGVALSGRTPVLRP